MKTIFVVIACLVTALATAGATTVYLHAQNVTHYWRLPDPYQGTVTVYDLAGVCLYVLANGPEGGVAAVPKIHLPARAGCQ